MVEARPLRLVVVEGLEGRPAGALDAGGLLLVVNMVCGVSKSSQADDWYA